MSIHGNQLLLPLFMRKDKNLPSIKENDELALAFYLLIKDLKEEEKILSFSRLLWPFLSIQGIISTHIFLDGITIFSKKGKLTNPPRQPLIGHLLRNVEGHSEIELLNKISDVLTYKDSEAEEIGEGEESEYMSVSIKALLDPEMLQSLMKLIPDLENLPIEDYVPLDTTITTDNALNISEKYRKFIETMKGNSLRWNTVSELIAKDVNKWITDLKVKIKDTDSRYSSQISKTSSTIDNTQIQEKMKLERDKIDRWKVEEKKKVIENIAALFKGIDRYLEEILKRNRFFSRDDALKSKILEQIFPNFESHFNFLKEEGSKLISLIDSLNQQYLELKAGSIQIDIEAEEKLEELEVNLQVKLQDRDKQLSGFEKEKQVHLQELDDFREQLESLFRKIYDIIQTKKSACLQESEELKKWTLIDTSAELFSKPIQWIHANLCYVYRR